MNSVTLPCPSAHADLPSSHAKLYPRLGRWAHVAAVIRSGRQIGATVTHDEEAGTVSIDWRGHTVFRGLAKDASADPVWVCMYSPQFFPRDDDEREAAEIFLVEADAKVNSCCGFFVKFADGSIMGTSGQRVVAHDTLAIARLPKFGSLAMLRIFLRWSELRGFTVQSLVQSRALAAAA